MKKDRLDFKISKLDNGITVHIRKTNDPFALIRIMIPVGSAHNTGDILPGSFHFLEHLVCCRSEMHPEYKTFKKDIALLGGGTTGAETGSFYTTYDADTSMSFFNNAMEGLVSMVFNPCFNEEDVEREKNIVSNERKRREPYFPMSSETSSYKTNQWVKISGTGLRTIFGTDEDLNSMTVSMMQNIHKHHYYSSDIHVVVIGGLKDVHERKIFSLLEKVTTSKKEFPYVYNQFSWLNQKYHEKVSSDINRFEYCTGFIFPTSDIKETIIANFITRLLVNNTQGSLYEWLRVEKGWVYELKSNLWGNPFNSFFELGVPLNSREQVDIVRSEINERIMRSLANESLIHQEFCRQTASSVFDFQTLNSIANHICFQIERRGQTSNEKTIDEIFQNISTSTVLQDFYNKYATPENTGELLIVPKNS